MRNPEGRHIPMSLGRKLALAGSIGLAAAGVGGVAYGAVKVVELRDQQQTTAEDRSLTWPQMTAIQDSRAREVSDMTTLYLVSILAAVAGISGVSIIRPQAEKIPQNKS